MPRARRPHRAYSVSPQTAATLRAELQAMSPDALAERVLRTAVKEYLTGHRTDSTRSATPEEHDAYQEALYEHYLTVHAYIRAASARA